ncbi:YfiR family protein [Methylogaea oryzae]|uniref:DUF4154 domain-containing protein n=1 Tax=Methylogaea oryzae TaxID=1295382 RepID=A0A8D5AH99_9GAMM|nr:YfiR family protein [Methylogaea oryzae]BBL71248.1 hypothetical protein MoryE10_18540 [Methylogaea oryzae]
MAGGANRTDPAPAADAEGGYPLKAAFLFNFIQYVEWPDNKQGGAEFALCVLGQNPFGASLQPLQSKTALGLPVVVKEIRQASESHRCHMLFIAESERPQLPKVLADLAGAGVLTVGDADGYAEAGVMIGFVVRQHKLRFAINLDAAKNGNVRISAHLLRLAEIVRNADLKD